MSTPTTSQFPVGFQYNQYSQHLARHTDHTLPEVLKQLNELPENEIRALFGSQDNIDFMIMYAKVVHPIPYDPRQELPTLTYASKLLIYGDNFLAGSFPYHFCNHPASLVSSEPPTWDDFEQETAHLFPDSSPKQPAVGTERASRAHDKNQLLRPTELERSVSPMELDAPDTEALTSSPTSEMARGLAKRLVYYCRNQIDIQVAFTREELCVARFFLNRLRDGEAQLWYRRRLLRKHIVPVELDSMAEHINDKLQFLEEQDLEENMNQVAL